jgi:hypothetical protein
MVICPFVLFVLAIVLSVLLRYTDSDYPFGIFKLFFDIFKQHFYFRYPWDVSYYMSAEYNS